MAYPRFRRARAHKFARRTTGVVSLNSTAWASVDTGLDLTLEAQVGDVIEYGLSALWGGEAVQAVLDVGTIVSSAVVSVFSTGGAEVASSGDGVTAWYGTASAFGGIGGCAMHQLVAGDISTGGTVTLRLRYRTNSAAVRSIYGTTSDPLFVYAKNLGPQDPN